MKKKEKRAIIVGAGPAGLTAGWELLKRTNIKPIILEVSADIGGISKTVDYKGNKLDIGGHRFYSKSNRVMNWWQNILPYQGEPSIDDKLLNRNLNFSLKENAPDPEVTDEVMLIRNRLSRIHFNRNFFHYPIAPSLSLFKNLGFSRILKIIISYIKIKISPISKEESMEDFFINRFGKYLYLLFFKDYTEKVWGVECNQIKPEWGAQRIKGLSISKSIIHSIKQVIKKDNSINQNNTETSLIDTFFYPKYGPGQLWEEVARQIVEMGGEIYFNSEVIGFKQHEEKIIGVKIRNENNDIIRKNGEYFFSSMPVKNLIAGIMPKPPKKIQEIANGLVYRDFITVGVLVKKLQIKNQTKIKTINNIIPDNWIYIQDHDIKMGRLQIFNNWSPYLIKDRNTVWLGLEYFCNKGDDFWDLDDKNISKFAIDELEKIGFICKTDILDSVVIKMPKTYPAYFGTYDDFHFIRYYTDRIDNLFLIGRNGMHKYNNADHSMLTAMTAVDNIINNESDKSNIWTINTEEKYIEEA